MLQDLRYAVRVLRGSPGFTVMAVLCIALGIGANTAIFSVVHAVLLQQLPMEEPDRLVRIWEHNVVRNIPRNVIGPANFVRWQERAESFEELAFLFPWEMTVAGSADPERARAGLVTANFFDMLQVSPLRGRRFGPEDVAENAEEVIILSEAYWNSRFAADPQILGQTLLVGNSPQTIVGVMSREVDLPDEVDFWAPFALGERHRESRGRWAQAIGRLATGVSVEQAQAELKTIAAQLEEETPDFNRGWTVSLLPLQDDLVYDVRTPIMILLGAVAFVLLIACANVANLMLAHGARRGRELAIRVALGADRLRVVRQVLTESLLLSILASGVGLLIATWSIEVLVRMGGDFLPRAEGIGLNFPVLMFTLVVSVATGLVFGLAPALHASRKDVVDGLQGSGRIAGDGWRQGSWGRNGLIVAQVALSLVLLIGAGLLINSFQRLTGVDPGYATDRMLTLSIDLPGSRYDGTAAQVAFFDQALERISALGDVERAAAISWLPVGSPGSATSYVRLDAPRPEAGQAPVADVRAITPGFFQTMEIPLLRGREFDRTDTVDGPARVVINRSMAEKHWPGESPLGKQIEMSWGDALVAEIIGVAEDVRLRGLDTATRDTLYWPNTQLPYDFMTILVRTSGDPLQSAAAVRAQIRAIDGQLPVADLQPLSTVLGRSVQRERFLVSLISVFSGLALVLALIGVYGVIAYATSRRTREFGVRIALGASPRDLLASVLGQGMRLALAGALIGVAVALALTRSMAGMLYEISPTDPLTFGVVVTLLALSLLSACYVPARRATRINPSPRCGRSDPGRESSRARPDQARPSRFRFARARPRIRRPFRFPSASRSAASVPLARRFASFNRVA